MKSSADAMSELMAGSMTTTGRTMDVTARLTYVPRDPHVITVTITDRAGAVPIWTIGRDLLLGGLIARASCPAGMGQIRLWTCQSRSGPSLIIARMTSFAAFLELDLKEVADFVMGTLELVPQDEEFCQLNLDAELGGSSRESSPTVSDVSSIGRDSRPEVAITKRSHRCGTDDTMPVRSERNAAAAVPVCLLDEGCGW